MEMGENNFFWVLCHKYRRQGERKAGPLFQFEKQQINAPIFHAFNKLSNHLPCSKEAMFFISLYSLPKNKSRAK